MTEKILKQQENELQNLEEYIPPARPSETGQEDENILRFGNKSWDENCRACLQIDGVNFSIIDDYGSEVVVQLYNGDKPRCMKEENYYCFERGY